MKNTVTLDRNSVTMAIRRVRIWGIRVRMPLYRGVSGSEEALRRVPAVTGLLSLP